jgi:hypothetical protein
MHLKQFLPGVILIVLKRTMKVGVSWLQCQIQWIVLVSLRTQPELSFPHIPIHYGGYRSYIPCGSKSSESSYMARPTALLKKVPAFVICKPKWKYVDQIAYFASYKPNRNHVQKFSILYTSMDSKHIHFNQTYWNTLGFIWKQLPYIIIKRINVSSMWLFN